LKRRARAQHAGDARAIARAMGAGAGAKVHGVSGKNLLKLVMKKRCAHTDKNLKLLIRMHMNSA
jgi:hypothetical protein